MLEQMWLAAVNTVTHSLSNFRSDPQCEPWKRLNGEGGIVAVVGAPVHSQGSPMVWHCITINGAEATVTFQLNRGDNARFINKDPNEHFQGSVGNSAGAVVRGIDTFERADVRPRRASPR